jgi:hypothetical protein
MNSPSKSPSADATKLIFEQTRNFMTCAALYAAGALATRRLGGGADWLPAWLSQGAGWGVMGLAVVLVLLNLGDGVRHLFHLRHPRLWVVLFVSAYLVASARVLTLVAAVQLGGPNSR